MEGLELDPVLRLTKDLKAASKELSDAEARYMVDTYYQMQRNRIRSGNQVQALAERSEPNRVVSWYADQNMVLENQIKRALDVYSMAHKVGQWSRSIVGIGPVIAAGLIAHIDIKRSNTAGKIWRFAGLDPTVTWEKGQKRPWNASLKTLCWKIGESFVKVSGHEEDVYGKLYLQRKALEIKRNDAGELAAQAEAKLKKFKIGKDTDAYAAYSVGKLPPAHIHSRAKRWAVKLFLSHWQQVAYFAEFGKPAPVPYVIQHLGHVDVIPPPNWPFD